MAWKTTFATDDLKTVSVAPSSSVSRETAVIGGDNKYRNVTTTVTTTVDEAEGYDESSATGAAESTLATLNSVSISNYGREYTIINTQASKALPGGGYRVTRTTVTLEITIGSWITDE